MQGLIPTVQHPGMAAAVAARGMSSAEVFRLFDDFAHLDAEATNGKWALVGNAGTLALANGVGGTVTVATDATDNDYAALTSLGKPFLFKTTKRLSFEAKVSITETTPLSHELSFAIGLMSATTTAGIQADAAGPLASYDGAIFWKVEGAAAVYCESSNAATQVTSASIGAWADGVHTFRIDYDPNDGVTGKLKFYYDATLVASQDITIAGLDDNMYVVIGAKAAATATAQTITVDYVDVIQER